MLETERGAAGGVRRKERGNAGGVRRSIVGILLLGTAACSSRGANGNGKNVRVTVPEGATISAAADSFARVGIINDGDLFKVYAWFKHDKRPIRPGIYMLHKGSSFRLAYDALHTGKGLVRVVTIPEGYSISQIATALETKLGAPRDSTEAAATDPELIRQLGLTTPTLEGYLFPDTYIFPESTSARAAVRVMVRRFEAVWKPEWTARLDTIHMTRNQVMSLAAIVEKEAKVPAERPVIAAVYVNRLRRGMLLQADPTVQYAMGKHVSRVLYKDLKTDSPYNTYRYKGLPPGPIASPGQASIEAALYPDTVPYEYFVAFPDGHHEFRKDLASHNTARTEARRAWSSIGAARRNDTPRTK